MLNGLDPIIIFQFNKKIPKVSEQLAKIPLISQIPTLVEQPPIPLYLSEHLTGIFIDAESKSVDASTIMYTKSDGSTPSVNQKGVASIVSVNCVANKNSLGLSLFIAMSELILDRLSSKEYYITYLHGSTTIFRGVLHSFAVDKQADDDLLRVKFELSRGDANNLPSITKPQQVLPSVTKVTGGVPT